MSAINSLPNVQQTRGHYPFSGQPQQHSESLSVVEPARVGSMSIYLFPPRDGPIKDDLSSLRRAPVVFVLSSRDAPRRGLIGMSQIPDVKRMAQRSLFPQAVETALELPIEKQHELHAAMAELLLTALSEDPTPEEANDDHHR
jgi:hypothetical protein